MLTASTRAECTKISRCCKTNERRYMEPWLRVYENAVKPVCLLFQRHEPVVQLC